MGSFNEAVEQRLNQTMGALNQTVHLPELIDFSELLDDEKAKDIIRRRFEGAIKKVMRSGTSGKHQGKCSFRAEAFTIDNLLVFAYITEYKPSHSDHSLMKEMLEWRLSKMKLDPTFLPVFFDEGVEQVLWFGVAVGKEHGAFEQVEALDDKDKVAKLKNEMGSAEEAGHIMSATFHDNTAPNPQDMAGKQGNKESGKYGLDMGGE